MALRGPMIGGWREKSSQAAVAYAGLLSCVSCALLLVSSSAPACAKDDEDKIQSGQPIGEVA